MSPFLNAATACPRKALSRVLAAAFLSAPLTFAVTHSVSAAAIVVAQNSTDGDESEDGGGGMGGLEDEQPLISGADKSDEEKAAAARDNAPSDNAEFFNDIAKAPQPVQRMRELIMQAAATGNVEKLRPLLNIGPDQTQLLLGGDDADPIETIKGFSGDDEGIEVLAILMDVLDSDFARVDAGTPDEMYVWPAFAEKNINTLTPQEKVKLLRIVTAGDLAGMQEVGNYNFFRIGISPDGKWKFFTAGD